MNEHKAAEILKVIKAWTDGKKIRKRNSEKPPDRIYRIWRDHEGSFFDFDEFEYEVVEPIQQKLPFSRLSLGMEVCHKGIQGDKRMIIGLNPEGNMNILISGKEWISYDSFTEYYMIYLPFPKFSCYGKDCQE